MKLLKISCTIITSTLAAVMAVISLMSLQAITLSPEEVEAIGIEAYIYGYPLVTMEKTRQIMTNVEVPTGQHAPMGQFAHAREYPTAAFKDITAPNADTLYSTAWLDLSAEPYILHVPSEKGRYYLMPILDGWTNVFKSPGTRTTGTKVRNFLITGPNWRGSVPDGLEQLKSPTNLVWILGRTYCKGTPADYKLVHAIQNRYSLTPLSSYGKPYKPSPGKIDASLDMKTPVREQVNSMSVTEFFDLLAMLMKNNPPASADAPTIAKMAKIGIVPGRSFDIKNLDPNYVQVFESIPKLGQKGIMAHEKMAGTIENGWVVSLDLGRYGTNYLRRALVAAIGLGANRPQDAIYPYTKVDGNGDILSGRDKYVIHFPKGQTPPVEGFWSLTMYTSDFFFVANPLNRYTLSPRNQLKYNPDGSLDLYIQHDSPGKDKEFNWLPAPQHQFALMLRFYWPKKSLINGTWKPPAVFKTKG